MEMSEKNHRESSSFSQSPKLEQVDRQPTAAASPQI